MDLISCGPTIFPTQYATKMFAAIRLFFVAPATFAMPMIMIRLTTGPKKPIIVYPTTGAAA